MSYEQKYQVSHSFLIFLQIPIANVNPCERHRKTTVHEVVKTHRNALGSVFEQTLGCRTAG